MTWDEFKAEAERLGLAATDNEYDLKGYKGRWWDISRIGDKKGLALLIAPDRDGWSYCGEVEHGTPADALREAARLMRGDVAGKLREWLVDDKAIAGGFLSMARTEEERDHNKLRINFCDAVLAKLDELEGIK